MALKPFDQLSERQKKRYGSFARKADLTPQEVYADPDLRAAAEGHGATPRHPETALRRPWLYQAYMTKNRESLRRRVNVRPDSSAAYAAGLKAIPGEYTHLVLLWSRLVPINEVPAGFTSRGPFTDLEDAENYLSGAGLPNSITDQVRTTRTVAAVLAWIPKDTDAKERKK